MSFVPSSIVGLTRVAMCQTHVWSEISARASDQPEVGLLWMRELYRSMEGFIEASDWVRVNWSSELVGGVLEFKYLMSLFYRTRTGSLAFSVEELDGPKIELFWAEIAPFLEAIKTGKPVSKESIRKELFETLRPPAYDKYAKSVWVEGTPKDALKAMMENAATCLVEGDIEAWKDIVVLTRSVALEIGPLAEAELPSLGVPHAR